MTCYISRAKTGGIKGGLGLAEDTSDAAISCQQVGPVELSEKIKAGKTQGDVVFQKRTSLVFKKLQVVRFTMQNVTRWHTWLTLTKSSTARLKTR